MPRIVVFDELATPQVVTRVTGPSENLGAWTDSGRTDYVVDPDLTGLATEDPVTRALTPIVPIRDWKHETGAIVSMTAGEIAARDAADAAAFDLDARDGAKNEIDGAFGVRQLVLRALADIVRDEINILRAATEEQAVLVQGIRDAIVNGNNLAQVQSATAALANLTDLTFPDRTLAQLRTAITNRIDSGQVDA